MAITRVRTSRGLPRRCPHRPPRPTRRTGEPCDGRVSYAHDDPGGHTQATAVRLRPVRPDLIAPVELAIWVRRLLAVVLLAEQRDERLEVVRSSPGRAWPPLPVASACRCLTRSQSRRSISRSQPHFDRDHPRCRFSVALWAATAILRAGLPPCEVPPTVRIGVGAHCPPLGRRAASSSKASTTRAGGVPQRPGSIGSALRRDSGYWRSPALGLRASIVIGDGKARGHTERRDRRSCGSRQDDAC